MTSAPRNVSPELPELKLPLGAWLGAGPIACLVVGGVGSGVSIVLGASQPISALYGGVAAALGVLLGAMVVLPWIPRPLDQWLNPLWGSQMLALASTVGFGFIIWKGIGGTGTSGAPFGFTGAAAFIVGQIAQGAVFYSVSRPIEKRLREARSAEAS